MSSEHCRICGRELSNETSIDRGIGPECYQKLMMIRRRVYSEPDLDGYLECNQCGGLCYKNGRVVQPVMLGYRVFCSQKCEREWNGKGE